MKYKATSTRFFKTNGCLKPTMTSSAILTSKTQLKNFIDSEIDTADADEDTINLQITARVVED